MNRIKMEELEAVVSLINTICNTPQTPWSRVDDRNIANIGNYHLDGAYGGYALHKMVNQGGGGITDIFHGHYSKRELYDRMQAFISGLLEAEKKQI